MDEGTATIIFELAEGDKSLQTRRDLCPLFKNHCLALKTQLQTSKSIWKPYTNKSTRLIAKQPSKPTVATEPESGK